MFKKFTKAASHDKDFRNSFILNIFFTMVFAAIFILGVSTAVKVDRILKTTEYIQATLTEGRIYRRWP